METDKWVVVPFIVVKRKGLVGESYLVYRPPHWNLEENTLKEYFEDGFYGTLMDFLVILQRHFTYINTDMTDTLEKYGSMDASSPWELFAVGDHIGSVVRRYVCTS